MQRSVLKGEGARGVGEMRSIHSGVPCISCHMTEGNHRMKVLRPDDPDLSEERADTCTVCHKGNTRKMRALQIQEWQSDYQDKMVVLQADLGRIDALFKAMPDALSAPLKSKLQDIRFNLSILARDGSRSAHNPDFALEIMSIASKDLQEISNAVRERGLSPGSSH
jgi:formate-dependent nitrite reductase cytochrome c552 subunit